MQTIIKEKKKKNKQQIKKILIEFSKGKIYQKKGIQLFKSKMMKRQYILKEKLDQGKHVEAFKAVKAVDQNEVVVAIKKLIDPKNKLHLEAFNRQKDILRKIKNQKYALQMLDELYYKDLNFVGLVLEFYDCSFNEIFELNKFNFQQIVAFSFQLLQGVLLLQQNGIILDNFKSDIILFNKHKGLFVIADFEHSKIINQQEEQLLNSNQIQDFQTGYDEQEINVFPIGKLLIELFLSRRLTIEENQQIKSKNFLEIIPEIISTENKKFVNEVLANMLNLDQRQRLQPFALIQKIKEFQVDESSLKLLNLASNQKEKQLKKICFSRDNNITKKSNLKDYQEVELNYNNQFKYCCFFTTFGLNHVNKAIQIVSSYSNIVSLNLNLSQNGIRIGQIRKYGLDLQKLQNLNCLNLNLKGNFFLFQGSEIIIKSLEKLTNIVSLTVNLGETYSGEAIQLIGEALEKFKKINYLNLCYDSCFTNSQQIQTFGMSLEKLQSLTQLTLNFHCNFIKKEAVKSLGVNIQKLQKLTNLNLDLSDIQNDEEGEVSLAKSLKTLKNLVTLKLNLKSFFYKYQNEWPYLRKMFLKMNKLVVITI